MLEGFLIEFASEFVVSFHSLVCLNKHLYQHFSPNVGNLYLHGFIVCGRNSKEFDSLGKYSALVVTQQVGSTILSVVVYYCRLCPSF